MSVSDPLLKKTYEIACETSVMLMIAGNICANFTYFHAVISYNFMCSTFLVCVVTCKISLWAIRFDLE